MTKNKIKPMKFRVHKRQIFNSLQNHEKNILSKSFNFRNITDFFFNNQSISDQKLHNFERNVIFRFHIDHFVIFLEFEVRSQSLFIDFLNWKQLWVYALWTWEEYLVLHRFIYVIKTIVHCEWVQAILVE